MRGLPAASTIKQGDGPRVIENLVADAAGDVEFIVMAMAHESRARQSAARGRTARRCGATGATCTARAARLSAWDSAEDYFRYARDAAFVDMVGHQGNDFQITDAFWKELNRLTAEFDEPGKFVCLPGYEWSGNTGMGGDRNIFYRREGRPIRRSSHILVAGPDLDRRRSTPPMSCSRRSRRGLPASSPMSAAATPI